MNSDDIDELGDIAGALGFNSFTTVKGENTVEVQEAVEDNREIVENELVNMKAQKWRQMECELEREKEGDTWKVEYPDHHQQIVPSDMHIIDAATYDNLKKTLVEESLKQEHEGKTLVWTCGICNKKWPENTRDTRRNSRRHMESHLVVKFQCLMCGNILKSKESFYHHRSSSCQQSGGAEVEYQILIDTSSVEAFNINKDGSVNYACGTE